MSTLGGYRDKCGGRSLGKQSILYGNQSDTNPFLTRVHKTRFSVLVMNILFHCFLF